MTIFKENKILFLWGAIALASALLCFDNPPCIQEQKSTVPDSIIHFSFTTKQKHKIDSLFRLKHKVYGFNGNVLVGQKDSVFYAQSFGFANFKVRDSLTLNHAFQLASVSKQFTAVAILQLYEKGLLNLSDSIQKFFPDFPYKNITIHQLLVHRSGLPNYHYFLQHIPTTLDTIVTNQDLMNEMILKFPEPYYRPNQRYHYSNTGYAILAALVEKVSGFSFNEYLRIFIFHPLKMYNTCTFLNKDNLRSSIATGYLKYKKPAEDNYLDFVLGDKGIYTSIYDLFKWDQGLYKNAIVNNDTLQKAFQPMGKPSYFKSNYGYGWRTLYLEPDSLLINFHAGWWHGFKSLLIRVPHDSTTIIILKNRTTGGSISTKQFVRMLYPSKPITDSVDFNY